MRSTYTQNTHACTPAQQPHKHIDEGGPTCWAHGASAPGGFGKLALELWPRMPSPSGTQNRLPHL